MDTEQSRQEDRSAHESMRELRLFTDSLRESIKTGSLKPMFARDPEGELFMGLEWPNCPYFGRIITQFGPRDLDMYDHSHHPWAGQQKINKYHFKPVTPTKAQEAAWLKLLAKGQVVCPISEEKAVRVYDYIVDFSDKFSSGAFKLLFRGTKYAFAVAFQFGADTRCTLCDVVEILSDETADEATAEDKA
jgi:hypothetical protein